MVTVFLFCWLPLSLFNLTLSSVRFVIAIMMPILRNHISLYENQNRPLLVGPFQMHTDDQCCNKRNRKPRSPHTGPPSLTTTPSSPCLAPATSWVGIIVIGIICQLLGWIHSLAICHLPATKTPNSMNTKTFNFCSMQSPFLSGMTSACTNPVLYGFLNESFKKEFKEMYVCAFMENLFNSTEFEQLYIRNLKIKCSRKRCSFQMV